MKFFIFFHLNLMFSSIPVDKRRSVIKKCYWPLLEIISKHQIPIAIEISGLTLEIIKKIEPKFIKQLKSLIEEKLITLVGSGYSQIIGPINSTNVNHFNLDIGNKIYKKILNKKPNIALINEQAFSKGLIKIYLRNKYKKIIMENNNYFSVNKNLKNNLKFFPQALEDDRANKIEVIWNDSLMFQQFQKYIHGEILEKEYLNFIDKITKGSKGYLSLYGNDAEVFNFRPGRYKEEKKILSDEWRKIENLLIKFHKLNKIVSIEKVTNNKKKIIKSNNFQNTIYVKKQNKYNISRWSVTGRNDSIINSHLHKFEKEKKNIKFSKKYIYLYSSDFRTNIGKTRWYEFQKKLKKFELKKNLQKSKLLKYKKFNQNNFYFENKILKLDLNIKKGLTFNRLTNKKKNQEIIKTFNQGTFQDINFLVDFFSGHLILESRKYGKITNLTSGKNKIYEDDKKLHFINKLNIFNYKLYKEVTVYKKQNSVELKCSVQTNLKNDIKVFRPFYFSLASPKNNENIEIYLCNGGSEEKYILNKQNNFSQSSPINNFVSSSTLSGMTNNKIRIKYSNKEITFFDCLENLKVYPMIDFLKVDKTKLFRLVFTVKENDDTSQYNELKKASCKIKIQY